MHFVVPFSLGLSLGVFIGLAFHLFLKKRDENLIKSSAEHILKNSILDLSRVMKDQLDSFSNLIKDGWLRHRSEMESLVKPIGEGLKEMEKVIRELEEKRERAYGGLKEQVKNLVEASMMLQNTTKELLETLKPPTVRGRWGEVQLRRIVELAGMVEHVDFEEQAKVNGAKPDMIVHLPGGGVILVDAKTPLGLSGAEKPSQVLRNRIKELGQKEYWRSFRNSPEFVVMFVPLEAPLLAAFQEDGELLEFAISQKVLITTPVTLLALLKAVSYGWQHYKMSEEIRTVAEQGRILHERLVKFSTHMESLKRAIENLVKAYNAAAGSFNSRLLPAARKLDELSGKKELKELSDVSL